MHNSFVKKITLLNQATLDSLNEQSKRNIIKRFTDVGQSILDADFGFVWFLNSSGFHKMYKTEDTPYEPLEPREAGTNVQTQISGKPLFVEDVKKSKFKSETKKHMKSAVIIPMVYRSESYGNLVLCYKNKKAFTAQDKALCIALGNSAAQALTIYEHEKLKFSLASIVESSQDAIFSKDLQGTVLTWNRGAEKLYEYKAKEIIGKKINLIVPKKQSNEVLEIIDKIKSGKKIESFETTRKTKSGDKIVVSLTVSPLTSPDKKIVGASVIARDITEAKKLEHKTLQLLKLRDEFLGVASHELKTPLTSIRGYGELLNLKLKRLKPDRETVSALKSINRNSKKLQRMINDLLDISRIETGRLRIRKEKFRLDKLTSEICNEFKDTVETHQIEVSDLVPVSVYADPHHIEQVITNLLNNAIKYSPDKDHIVVSLDPEKDEVTVSVQDFGMGIGKVQQLKIFQRYYQINKSESQPGLGLGLYIAKKIIDLHDGKIWLTSKPNQGTTFHFSLKTVRQ